MIGAVEQYTHAAGGIEPPLLTDNTRGGNEARHREEGQGEDQEKLSDEAREQEREKMVGVPEPRVDSTPPLTPAPTQSSSSSLPIIRPDEVLNGYKVLVAGGYNTIWAGNTPETKHIILRLPNEDAALPYQLENEVGWLQRLRDHPTIPVPRVLAYSSGLTTKVFDDDIAHLLPKQLRICNGAPPPPFLAMTRINGERLCNVWKSYSPAEKIQMAKKLANLILDLAAVTEAQIASLNGAVELAPPTEHTRFVAGRLAIYDKHLWNIGPYSDSYSYIAATFSREIVFHTNPATKDAIDMESFEEVSIDDHVRNLQRLHDAVSHRTAQPRSKAIRFYACHGDLHGRNILVSSLSAEGSEQPSPHITGLLDFEFANFLPLSEVNSDAIELLEPESEGEADESMIWGNRIAKLVVDEAKSRGWDERDVLVLQGKDPYTEDPVPSTDDPPDDELGAVNSSLPRLAPKYDLRKLIEHARSYILPGDDFEKYIVA